MGDTTSRPTPPEEREKITANGVGHHSVPHRKTPDENTPSLSALTQEEQEDLIVQEYEETIAMSSALSCDITTPTPLTSVCQETVTPSGISTKDVGNNEVLAEEDVKVPDSASGDKESDMEYEEFEQEIIDEISGKYGDV